MKRNLFKRTAGAFVAAAFVAVAVLAGTHASKVLAQGQAQVLSGTIFGNYDFEFEGKGAWVGYAIFDFGDGNVLRANFADRNTSKGSLQNGAIYGTETISLTFLDGSGTLEMSCRFDGTPGSTPSLYTLHEVCSLGAGTGKYARVSGQVVTHGPFVFPRTYGTPGAPPWISEMHGVIFGLE